MSTEPRRKRPLLAAGNEEEWARINAEEREMTPPPETPVGELLRRGQHLSAQAAKLVRAVKAGRARARS